MQKRIKLFYFKDKNNFGDMMGPLMIERLFNIKTEYADPWNTQMISIGSIIDVFCVKKLLDIRKLGRGLLFKRKPLVWGSGFLYPSHWFLIKNLEVHSVRGQLSAKRLGLENNIPLGDPGLLADRLIDKKPAKRFKYGIVPHYADSKSLYIKRLEEILPDNVVVDVLAPVVDVIKTIASCDVIVSTSMHGLIVADSFGIPNLWARTNNDLLGGDFKFRDYYSIFGIINPDFINLHEYPFKEEIDLHMMHYKREGLEKIKESIYGSFPCI